MMMDNAILHVWRQDATEYQLLGIERGGCLQFLFIEFTESISVVIVGIWTGWEFFCLIHPPTHHPPTHRVFRYFLGISQKAMQSSVTP